MIAAYKFAANTLIYDIKTQEIKIYNYLKSAIWRYAFCTQAGCHYVNTNHSSYLAHLETSTSE